MPTHSVPFSKANISEFVFDKIIKNKFDFLNYVAKFFDFFAARLDFASVLEPNPQVYWRLRSGPKDFSECIRLRILVFVSRKLIQNKKKTLASPIRKLECNEYLWFALEGVKNTIFN
jgi:hypothetical protein